MIDKLFTSKLRVKLLIYFLVEERRGHIREDSLISDEIRSILVKIFVILFRSFARLVIGRAKPQGIYKKMKLTGLKIGREINPIVWSIDTLKKEKNSGLIKDIAKKGFIVIKVDEDELKNIDFAEKGMDTGNYSRVMAVAYRPIEAEHHKNVFEFLNIVGIDGDLVEFFDGVRKGRNDFIYGNIESITDEETKEIVIKAREFVQDYRTKKRGGEDG